jgi:hypothetical protein
LDAKIKALLYDPSITALVGNRIFPEVTEQDPPSPYIIWKLIDSENLGQHLTGTLALARFDLRIEIYAERYVETIPIANAIRAKLDQHRAVDIAGIFWKGENQEETESLVLRVQNYACIAK